MCPPEILTGSLYSDLSPMAMAHARFLLWESFHKPRAFLGGPGDDGSQRALTARGVRLPSLWSAVPEPGLGPVFKGFPRYCRAFVLRFTRDSFDFRVML